MTMTEVASARQQAALLTGHRGAGLADIRKIADTLGLLSSKTRDLWKRFEVAFSDERIRKCLELQVPPISDLTATLGIEGAGSLHAIRMDLYPGVGNLKKPVVAGLILQGILTGRLPRETVDTLADAGNMNTGFALRYYCEKFCLQGYYVMSRYFPADMVNAMRGDEFTVVQAGSSDRLGLEEEFYRYLHERVRDSTWRRNKHCLWHAKFGGKALRPLGRQTAGAVGRPPDYIVVSVGAGSTLQYLLAMREEIMLRTGKSGSIIVAEHVRSPIYACLRPRRHPWGEDPYVLADSSRASFDPGLFRPPPCARLRHSVIGPHFEKANPLLPAEAIEAIQWVQMYDDPEWMSMSHFLEANHIGVGNSSAAQVSVAARLARMGSSVVTVIMEPMRRYYKRDGQISSTS